MSTRQAAERRYASGRVQRRTRCLAEIGWFVLVLVVVLAMPASAGAATGPIDIHYYQRPGSACASTNPTAAGAQKYTSAVSQTGLAFDGTELLVSCWGRSMRS